MKNLAILSLITGAIAIGGCQQLQQAGGGGQQQSSQQAAEEAAPLPVVSTGTCVFGSKSGRKSITTTHTDCALRNGNFIPGNANARGGAEVL